MYYISLHTEKQRRPHGLSYAPHPSWFWALALGPELEMGLWEAIKIQGGQHCRAFTQQGCVLLKRGGTEEPVCALGRPREDTAGGQPPTPGGRFSPETVATGHLGLRLQAGRKAGSLLRKLPRPRRPMPGLELGLK